MGSRISRRLVIDASVAAAAGGNGSPERVGMKCSDVLLAVRKHSHRVIMTAEICDEWDAKQSNFAAKWRRWMESHCQTLWLTPEQIAQVVLDLKKVQATLFQRARMQEDVHLVKAAVRTDKVMLSLDDEVRGFFAAAVDTLPILGGIMWANPKEEAKLALWITKGAPAQEARMLRNYAPALG